MRDVLRPATCALVLAGIMFALGAISVVVLISLGLIPKETVVGPVSYEIQLANHRLLLPDPKSLRAQVLLKDRVRSRLAQLGFSEILIKEYRLRFRNRAFIG